MGLIMDVYFCLNCSRSEMLHAIFHIRQYSQHILSCEKKGLGGILAWKS